ncbi:MAG TPA: hypothetical protein VF281_01950 [Candidatus Saccharimonadales bacterium]
MSRKITDYFLYRWRYIIGYGVIGLTIVGLLLVAFLYAPGGLSENEMKTVVASGNLSLTSLESFKPTSIINLPYNLLQHASMALFGVNNLSIKLPSLILGGLSAVGMILLLQMWFRRNVAVLTTVLIITTGQFLFMAQNGTPGIGYIFWSVWLLVAAMMVSRRAKFLGLWKVILFSSAAFSLYTPLSIYILIALISAVALHPHLRYLMRQLLKARAKVAIASACALIIITPLIYGIIKDPSVALTLLGIPSEMPDLKENLLILLKQYFSFMSISNGVATTPIYSLGSMILIVLGIIRLSTTKYTARSYIISAWVLLLLPVLLINPAFTSITFVPAMLLMAMGISTLLRSWYQLFPKNPYARIVGLLPLTILVGGMFFSGLERYVYSYTNNPQVATYFSHDLKLLNKQLAIKSRPNITLLVSPAEKPFYDIVARHNKKLVVSTPSNTTTPTTIVSRDAYAMGKYGEPKQIVTDPLTNGSDRFYIYKRD